MRILLAFMSVLVFALPTGSAHAVTATIYIDSNSSGDFDAGEEDNTFFNANGGGTHVHAYDVIAPGAGSTSEVIIDFDLVDNEFRAVFNGTNVCAPTVCQLQANDFNAAVDSFLEFATGEFVQPWRTNTTGLPRVRLTVTESGYTLVGTRTRTSGLEPIIFRDGAFGANPNFTIGQNIVTIVNPNGTGADRIQGSISASFDEVGISIGKSASPSSVDTPSAPITYSLLVTNTGDYEIVGMTVSDTIATVICQTSGTDTIASLAVGASETCTAVYAVAQSDFDTNGGGDGDIDNTGSVSGTSDDVPVSDSDSQEVTLVLNPSLTFTKIATPDADVVAGQTVNYEYTVTNNGNITIDNVSVSDAHLGLGTAPVPGNEAIETDALPTDDSTDAAVNGSWDVLRPGDSITFSGSYVVVQGDVDAQ